MLWKDTCHLWWKESMDPDKWEQIQVVKRSWFLILHLPPNLCEAWGVPSAAVSSSDVATYSCTFRRHYTCTEVKEKQDSMCHSVYCKVWMQWSKVLLLLQSMKYLLLLLLVLHTLSKGKIKFKKKKPKLMIYHFTRFPALLWSGLL